MARRTRIIGWDLNRMNHEIRMAVVQMGTGILEKVAQMVADEANKNAPTLQEPKQTREWIRKHRHSLPAHRNGPIKGNIFSMPSEKVPASYLVVSPAWYSHFYEFGTDPTDEPIKGRHGKDMAFFGENGSIIHKSEVKPHSWKGKAFLRPAADKAEQFIEQIISTI